MEAVVEISLTYDGRTAGHHGLDFYDGARALIGFQRSLALTAHLVLNNEIITQSPSLRGAEILFIPPEQGSWKTKALVIIGTTLWASGTVSRDTPIGNLISSAYDYVIDETLGFHVDYNKSLGQQYEEYKHTHPDIQVLHQGRLDSLAEKCVPAIIDMHRPIVFSETAASARLTMNTARSVRQIGHPLNTETYEYVNTNVETNAANIFCGSITSYNSNAFAGRIYLPEERRPISFYLTEDARTQSEVDKITRSLFMTARQNTNHTEESKICFKAFSTRSKSGKLKKLTVIEVD